MTCARWYYNDALRFLDRHHAEKALYIYAEINASPWVRHVTAWESNLYGHFTEGIKRLRGMRDASHLTPAEVNSSYRSA